MKQFFGSGVTNFPEGYAWYKKLLAQIAFFFARIVIHDRKNLLTQKDIRHARKLLQKGDIVLVGNLRTLFSKLVKGPVTHTLLYVGHGKFIHAIVNGVGYISYQDVVTMYDTMIVLRVPEVYRTRELTSRAIAFARSQVGKPYNFFLNEEELSFFCSQLVNSAYTYAGYDTGLKTKKHSKFGIDTILHPRGFSAGALQASDMTGGNFNVICMSHNIVTKKGKLVFLNNGIFPFQSLRSDTAAREE